MIRLLPALFVAALALSLFAFPSPAAAQQEGNEGKRLFHVVSLKFKESATKEQIKGVEEAFAGLQEKIPGIVAMTWGTNVSPEKHAKGFTHCFVLVFESEKARDEYLPHPEHKKFGQVLGPVMADVFVIDFWGEIKRRED